jgi:hypothetical protein
MKMSGQLHVPAALLPGRSSQYPVGSTVGLDVTVKRNISVLARNQTPDVQPGTVTILTELPSLQIKSVKRQFLLRGE